MPRWLEAILSWVALLLLAPVFFIVSLAILILDGSPVIFAHERIGRNGKPFRLFKFRSMRAFQVGPSVTAQGDARVTFIGAYLRKFKLDELPQLLNILRGEMSFVGPRPEVKEFVDLYTSEQRRVLEVRPGITDPASIEFHNESEILSGSEDWRKTYVEQILPEKLALSLNYIQHRSIWTDLKVIARTVGILCKTRVRL